MNAVVIGVSWYESEVRREVVVVGDARRTHLDHVLARVPERLRPEIAHYLAPLLEGREPIPGIYRDNLIAWWKRAEVMS